MRTKRRVRKSTRFHTDAHLRKLGFAHPDEYLRWCECNGFALRTDKSREDRRSELLHALTVGPGWRALPPVGKAPRIRVRGDAREVEDKVFSGQLTIRHVVDKRYRPLAKAVARLPQAGFARHRAALRRLFAVCRERDVRIFSFAGRPYEGCREATLAEALALMAMDTENWLRAPEEWSPAGQSPVAQFRDLVCHLYVRHSIPEFLIRAWFQDDVRESRFSLRVFRHIAAGHSIRTLPIGLNYSRRMSHYFLQAPRSLTVRQAIRWGQVRGMGGSGPLANAVADTTLGSDFSDGSFWQSVIEWLIKNPIKLSLLDDIIRFLNNQKFGVGNPVRCIRDHRGRIRRVPMKVAQPGLTMKERTPAALIREVRRFERLEEVYGRSSQYIWTESGIRSFRNRDRRGDVWTIEELLGNGALLEEGQRMSHCVGGYAEDCLRGTTTIWSMCRLTNYGSKHVLTVEVEPGSRRIVEARGFANRLPSSLEFEILKMWGRDAWLDWRPIEALVRH